MLSRTRILRRPLPLSFSTPTLLWSDCQSTHFLRSSSHRVSPCHRNLSQTISTNSTSENEHFFRYTSGRWLWDEERQLRDRFRIFNVQELKRIAAESVGAKCCVSIDKLAEGGYNKVFRLVMDNGCVAIARIPNPNAGPVQRVIASEVATMDFVRTILDIPVPKVYAWSSTSNNPVGAEYIIMEEAPGIRLGEVWYDMKMPEKKRIVEGVVEIEKKLLSISFTRYGNLYFASDAFPGCEAAKVMGNIPSNLKNEIEERFTIGPVVDRDSWKGERASMPVDRGPWENMQDYLLAIADREIAWISSFGNSNPSKDVFASETQNSTDAHISLYQKFSSLIAYLVPKNKELATSHLWHWDVHSGNIFVEDDRITSIIDWQETWTGPLFLQFRHPKLVDYDGEVLLRLPDHYESLDQGDEKARIRKQVEKSIVLYSYETDTRTINPLLNEILGMHYGRTIRETIQFASNTWDRNIIPFRQSLIQIERNWDGFGFDIPCPIHFTEVELRDHYRECEGWNKRADFWSAISGLVSRDGWTSNETYDGAFEMFAELREEGLKYLTDEDRVNFEAGTRWAIRRSD